MESLELAQKSMVKWSIEGDKNSKYYHIIINKQRNKLAIQGIIVDGVWIEEPIAVKNEFLYHFRDRFWSLIEDDVVDAVNHFFNNGYRPKGCHFSFVALISKTQDTKIVQDFRPISLIGSLYKIIAKLLANRLVTVMGDLVNEVQFAFIANQKFLDDPFILNEIIHWCKAKKKQTTLFKAEFEKAFDSIRWDFLDDVLKNFRFAVENSMVDLAANSIACMDLNLPFLYMRVNIGGHMSRINSWDDIINKIHHRLSKWNMKSLSIGGRLTLLKSVLGLTLIYYMSMFKALIHEMESSRFLQQGISLMIKLSGWSASKLDGVSIFRLRMKDLYKNIARWWDINMMAFSSYKDWWFWFSNLRLSSKLKMVLEGVFYITWWPV
nr:RNA-directed DNA polymerase, eukaryota, reverse transcriptase zinc-binding domain protein [Tanacetum cinerariifolium]